MGVSHIVVPLGPDLEQWLDEHKVWFPHGARGRRATPRELWEAASTVDGFIIRYVEGGSFAQVIMEPTHEEGRYVLFSILNGKGLDEPASLGIEKSWPEDFLPVLIRLSEHTGPLVVVEDASAAAVVVTPDRTLEALLAELKRSYASDVEDEERQ